MIFSDEKLYTSYIIKSQVENAMLCGAYCQMNWDDAVDVAQKRCNAFKYKKETQTCDLGFVGPFGGDFDAWPVVDNPGIHVLSRCLPKSKKHMPNGNN
jgi:hypothetical protein